MKKEMKHTKLVKNENGKKYFWDCLQINKRLAYSNQGELGKIGKTEQIRTDIFHKVIDLIEEKKKELLEQNYRKIPLEVFDVSLSELKDKAFDETNIPEDLDDLIDDLIEEINEYLLERGLTSQNSFIKYDENIRMRFFSVDSKLTDKLIFQKFNKKIKNLRIKLSKRLVEI